MCSLLQRTGPPTHVLADIQLWSSNNPVRSLIGPNAKLHFLSLVHVSSIPLFLVAGSILEVSTDDDASTAWLAGSILDQGQDFPSGYPREPWWEKLGKQSDQGILLKVEQDEGATEARRIATELLLYAAVDSKSVDLPTPPASSSPVPPSESLESSHRGQRVIKIYALPLSSKLLDQVADLVGTITLPPEQPTCPSSACFLPYEWNRPQGAQIVNQKRQNLSALFDDATQKRRKLKGGGGESVAQVMAGIDGPISKKGYSHDTPIQNRGQPTKSAEEPSIRKSLSRRSSTISNMEPDLTRAASRPGALANGKRSSLHRVESAISPRDSPSFSDLDDTVSTRNKAALSKIVMAGMRLYGLQQKKKKSERSQMSVEHGDLPEEPEAEEEYKLVYHQTFKAATFVFRRQFSAQVISQVTMRDVVDRFLDLFCINPMVSSDGANGEMAGFGTQTSDPFRGLD